jgi:5-methylcytosine-specific restriction endonuclease McrA
MIPVVLAPEPLNFDQTVRQPGLDAIREMVGEVAIATRPGRKRNKIATSREDIPSDKFPPFWRGSLDDMLTAYRRLCAYSCMYIERVTGNASVDHMFPKSETWDQVYEWKNYRLACGLMNSRKNDARDVLDPFEIQDGWFALEFTGYQVVCGQGLDSST